MTVAYSGSGVPLNAYLGSGALVMGASSLGAVTFTTTGATFSPSVELASGSSAVVTWQTSTGAALATGLNPTISFGSSAVRTVRMHVTDYAAVRSLNLGFNASDDAGREGPSSSYNKAAEACSGVSGLGALTGLVQFMAANGNLTGQLDLTGLSSLLYVECFFAQLTSVVLTGCSSLRRLCLEANHITSLDLNPVAASLRDLRAAIQWYPTLAHTLDFIPLTADMAQLWHYCVRDQSVSRLIPFSRLPVLEQHWCWATGLTTLDSPASALLRDINDYGNSLDQASVDRILVATNANIPGSGGGTIDLSGSAAPSSTGVTARTALRSRGWTVTTA